MSARAAEKLRFKVMRPGGKRRRRGARVVLFGAIRQIPAFARLLIGLFRDRHVASTDKLLVAAALAYLLMPFDLVADFIPFLGMVDDVFLVALTIRRMIRNAGMNRVLRHWEGEPSELRVSRIAAILAAARMFLPKGTRRQLSSRRKPGSIF